mmetsp:Transcript_111979/g.194422  ORF Transcript_111979/g.194422 Transcript_111979/m.194422 type:complete len:209 (-) Transcript_111979:1478-2104(-)
MCNRTSVGLISDRMNKSSDSQDSDVRMSATGDTEDGSLDTGLWYSSTFMLLSHPCSWSVSTVGRCEGSFWKHCRTKSCPSQSIAVGMTGSHLPIPMLKRIENWLFVSGNGESAVAISTTVHPRDHTSDALEPPPPRHTSGAIHFMVPFRLDPPPPSALSIMSAIRLEAPKSVSLMLPRLSIRMFAPLMSRWTMSFWWRNCSPMRIWLV